MKEAPMNRQVGPVIGIAVIVTALLVIGWFGWRTVSPPLPMSREEYIKARNDARMEIIQRARSLPNRGQ
jgi:hypothetical protein